MRTVKAGLLFVSFCSAVILSSATAYARPSSKTVESGKTQVVAKAGGREITLSELRAEMARLRLSPNDPEAERIALEGVINRTLLAAAARKAELHRRPEALAQMRAAQDQALADLYLGVTSQPAEPSRQEIDAYVTANSSLFAERRSYEFSVLSVSTAAFDEDAMTTLFDEEKDFSKLEETLRKSGIDFSTSNAAQPSSAFPKAIREQLARYSIADNIVLKGEAQTQIMKIMRVRKDSTPSSEWPVLARRILLEEKSVARAEALIERLKTEGRIAYFRKSAAPKSNKGEETASVSKPRR